jgi:hypothetical protein
MPDWLPQGYGDPQEIDEVDQGSEDDVVDKDPHTEPSTVYEKDPEPRAGLFAVKRIVIEGRGQAPPPQSPKRSNRIVPGQRQAVSMQPAPPKTVIRYIRVPPRVPQPVQELPTKSLESYQFKKKPRPVVTFHDIGGNPNTNFSSLPRAGKKKKKR